MKAARIQYTIFENHCHFMTYVLGIDGGGSNLRAVLTDRQLSVLAQTQGGSANPNVVGREASGEAIRRVIRDILAAAQLSAKQIAGIGIGIAGASQPGFRDWLQQVLADVTPGIPLAISSDFEIALVGAHGRRLGLLVLAGTGSLAYGVNSRGDSALVGGWGYLLGDEGGGYWLGMEGLRAWLRMADGRGAKTTLAQPILDQFQLEKPQDIVQWLYQANTSRVRQIAELAPIVLDHAAGGDVVARDIVTRGARELALAARTVLHRLDMEPLPIAFTGSLLNTPNALSEMLCALLGLPAIPANRHAPAIGAALLALHMLEINK
jgi:N-acetylglucosamine kinase-like BadF-type ATPase